MLSPFHASFPVQPLFLVAIAAFGRTGVFIGVAPLACLVGPILAESFNLARALFMAQLAILQRFLVFLVVKGNIAILGGQGHNILGHDRYRAEKNEHNRRNTLFQENHLAFQYKNFTKLYMRAARCQAKMTNFLFKFNTLYKANFFRKGNPADIFPADHGLSLPLPDPSFPCRP